MFVGNQPEMALFHPTLPSSTENPWTNFTITYHPPNPTSDDNEALQAPFSPDSTQLKKINIEIHTDPAYPAYIMPEDINNWFSERFGYPVLLAYLGDGLGIKKNDEEAKNWIATVKPLISSPESVINFSDGAPLLLTSESSLEDLHPRLGGEKVIHEKFRPNIIVDGEGVPWDEDYWAEVKLVKNGLRIVLVANCSRCTSINVDLDKGQMGKGESGKLLKKMMKDRRIDKGDKWSPIFGRYGFPTHGGEIKVGDEVVVSRRNKEHTIAGECCCKNELALADCSR